MRGTPALLSVFMAAAVFAAIVTRPSPASCAHASAAGRSGEGLRVLLGVCDWTIGKTGDPASLGLAGSLGCDGVQVSLVPKGDSLALLDPALRRAYLEVCERRGVAIASFAIGDLKDVPLKSDHSPFRSGCSARPNFCTTWRRRYRRSRSCRSLSWRGRPGLPRLPWRYWSARTAVGTQCRCRSRSQPSAHLEWNQPVLAHPRQSVDFPASCKDELVVRIVEQDRGQARDGLVDGNRCEVTSFGQLDPLRGPAEQLGHDRKAIIGRFLESIEDRLPSVVGLSISKPPASTKLQRPFVILGAATALRARSARSRVAATVILVAALAHAAAMFPSRWSYYLDTRRFTVNELEGTARWCREHLPPDAVHLIHDAGYIATATPFRLIDMVGLKTPSAITVNREITFATCGKGRSRAAARIAAEGRATHLVVLKRWDMSSLFTYRLQLEGWTVTRLYSGEAYRSTASIRRPRDPAYLSDAMSITDTRR